MGRLPAYRTHQHNSPMKSTLALTFSVLALIVSAVAGYHSLHPAARHKPLSAYDFSTPAAAVTAQTRILADGNYPALMEKEFRGSTRKAKEKLRTLEIKKEAEWKGTKLVFVSFEEGGVRKFAVEAFEKEADSGLWFPVDFSRRSLPGEALSLEQSIDAWERDGTLLK